MEATRLLTSLTIQIVCITGMISSPGKPSAEVTLNMLNSSPDDMDVVGGIYNDDDDVRLDFVSSHEEVP
uniref:Uncharacterized protein n=1 Tax=Rhodnius prolixus TaxID=13249 RepID=T1HM57_RHOPR